MKQFIFETKARTLENLKKKISNVVIPEQTFFTVKEWELSPVKVIEKIRKQIKGKKIIIRSSAKGEDSSQDSMAGQFKSIPDIDIKSDKEIKKAVDEVIKSYKKGKDNDEGEDEVLVQEYIDNVVMGGVIFTHDVNNGAPYIIINYDDRSGSTDSVTSGNSNALKIFYYKRDCKISPSNKNLNSLIDLVHDLERITGNDALDIEFAINPKNIYLLQVRPITTLKKGKRHSVKTLEDHNRHIEKLKDFFNKHNVNYPNLHGYRAIYGIMPDWNPAEIIGINPRPLAFSLYQELITDEMWPLSRRQIGYKDVGYQPGIVSFGGKPYVDIRLSFNTFLPVNISAKTSEKLVNYYIDKLIRNPELHDKVEFKIAHTAYHFDFNKKKEDLIQNNFSNLQIQEIEKSLIEFTDNLVSEKVLNLDYELQMCQEMSRRRENIKSSDIPLDVKIIQLVYDCKHLGTLAFSKLARCAFVSNILLKSLLDKGVLSEKEHGAFLNSIKTVASELLYDLYKLKKYKISKPEFLDIYGHLRPGTYDISSLSYSENFENYIDLSNISDGLPTDNKYLFTPKTLDKINKEIKSIGFNFDSNQFIQFCIKSIQYREKSKFEFTKNISLAFDYIRAMLPEFSRDEISFLNIKDIIEHTYKIKPNDWSSRLHQIIKDNKNKYATMELVKLPPLIYLDKNFEYFHMMDDQPNYITNKNISGDIVYIDTNISREYNLTGKIVLIENADPGYDWVFSRNISGLITKYGGTGSHMSIRAAEFKLPAAIGCGSYLFDYVKSSNKIELNCGLKQIKRII